MIPVVVVLAFVAATLLAIYHKDKTYSYRRTIDVDVPPDELFSFVIDMRNWERFYPNTLFARYDTNEAVGSGTMSIEKYWGISGYHVFRHQITTFSAGQMIQWTGRTIYGGLMVQMFLPAARQIVGTFAYHFEPLDNGRRVRWTRTCAFAVDGGNIFHRIFYICYMPIFRLDLMRALAIYQDLCKAFLEDRAARAVAAPEQDRRRSEGGAEAKERPGTARR